jgi:hypothetical protein
MHQRVSSVHAIQVEHVTLPGGQIYSSAISLDVQSCPLPQGIMRVEGYDWIVSSYQLFVFFLFFLFPDNKNKQLSSLFILYQFQSSFFYFFYFVLIPFIEALFFYLYFFKLSLFILSLFFYPEIINKHYLYFQK